MKRAERGVDSTPPALTTTHPLYKGHVMATAEATVTYKDIPGHPGYRVGDDGSVWTCRERVSRGYNKGTRAVIGTTWRRVNEDRSGRDGRPRVTLADRKRYSIHKLVLLSFVGPCPAGMESCHEDGDKMNNRRTNLRWDTRASNVADKIRHGTIPRGEQCYQATLTVERVRAMRAEYEASGITFSELARKHNVSKDVARLAVLRLTWKHV